MESSGPRSKLFSNGLYPDTWTGAISNFDIAWPLWFEYVTVAHPMLDPTKQHLKEIIFHATYCVNFPSPSSFKMISSLQAIPWFDWKVVVGSLFVILPCLTYLTTTASSISAMHSKEVGRTPPSVPYWFPYLGSLIPFLRNSAKFTIEVKDKYGESTPVAIKLGPLRIYLVSAPEYFLTLLKSSRNLTSKPIIALSMENTFGTPSTAVHVYKDDNSGVSPNPLPGTNVAPSHRIWYLLHQAAHKYLSGKHLHGMTQRFMDFFVRNIAEDETIGEEWVEMPDLFGFLQDQVFRAAIKALAGPHLLSLNPTFVEDFWAFINVTPIVASGIPRWMAPSAYKARDKVLVALTKWHRYAAEHSDYSKTGPDDPEWDEYWGSQYMKARQQFMRAIPTMDEKALVSDDLVLLFAANGNTINVIIWFIVEVLLDPSLAQRLAPELAAARIPPTAASQAPFDIDVLCAQPLLQSVYAEILRLRVALVITRTSERDDVRLGAWTLRARQPICLSTMTAAQNPGLWDDAHPLDGFYADRFLVDPADPASGPLRKSASDQKAAAVPPPSSDSKGPPTFSLDGLAGAWIPYGGGQFMCPGRHFAKQEIIGSFAVFHASYEVELQVPAGWRPSADERFFGTGAMPPKGVLPFRVRKRAGM